MSQQLEPRPRTEGLRCRSAISTALRLGYSTGRRSTCAKWPPTETGRSRVRGRLKVGPGTAGMARGEGLPSSQERSPRVPLTRTRLGRPAEST
jgi:hypothetical protein